VKEVNQMSVGSRIKELRENKDMSRSELADKIGVTIGAVSNYENEVSSPKEPILFKIMEVLECDANYLFQDSIDMPSMKNNFSVSEHNLIKKYRELDTHGKDMVDTVLQKEYDHIIELRDFAPQSKYIDKDPDNIVTVDLTPLAAHVRTDVEQTPEGVQHDLDIMNDDSQWE